MDSDERIKRLEEEIARLREKEKKLEHDVALYRQIFDHLKAQFEEMKRELLKR
jgi:predicted nuclease with TOPRIM domain